MNCDILIVEEPIEDTDLNAAYENEQRMRNMCPDTETLLAVFPNE